MMIIYNGNDVLVKNAECFDLDLTLDCGQAFRWEKQEDGSYCGVAGGRFLTIQKIGKDILLKNTTKENFEYFWKDYFDFERDYTEICSRLKKDALLSSTIDEYYGIRILRQEPWEALCSFVISQQNNIKRIKRIISKLCEAYGADLGNGYFTFPDAETLSRVTEEELRAIGLGYRAKYIERLAKSVASGETDLDRIGSLTLDEARAELLKIYGVGVKVADCALLFGFGFDSAFPVDVWMKRVMTYYPDGLPECFSGIEGIAQQYLFHWARNHLS